MCRTLAIFSGEAVETAAGPDHGKGSIHVLVQNPTSQDRTCGVLLDVVVGKGMRG